MAQGKQAKILTQKDERQILLQLKGTRYPNRDTVLFLLSLKAGLRSKEIAGLTWGMVTTGAGEIADTLSLEDRISKGKGGRTIPMNAQLKKALIALHQERGDRAQPDLTVIFSERGGAMSAGSAQTWFYRLYRDLKLTGCSSHSGRRTFITRGARKVSQVGGSLRDVQQLAGHATLSMTQLYIEGDSEAKRKLVDLI